METEKSKIYCSLDIETSGFDPLKDEILEVGFAFFVVNEKGIKITEEWTQVFKPKSEVPAKILGLTGITQKELEKAPAFLEHKDFIHEKLKDACIVGHNVSFDIKFLETNGIKFSGQVVDTLDLVQFLLPTHHSYNLENLMHYFKIEHKDAHRALADSKAALKVLERLLGIFNSFSKELKAEIADLVKNFNFTWKQLLLEGKFLALEDLALYTTEIAKKSLEVSAEPPTFSFETQTIYNFPLGENVAQNLLNAFKKGKEKVLLVLPKQQQALDVWQEHKIKCLFTSEFLFDETKFKKYLKKKDLSEPEVKFLLKVLVWKYTNWQTECVLDLNLSFFGGQFKSLLCGGKVTLDNKTNLLCCDQSTFLSLSKDKLYKNRQVVILGMNEFETNVSSNISERAAWGYISYLLKSFYNPEVDSGDGLLKETVVKALEDTDLYFGLVSAILQTTPPTFQYVKITPDFLQSRNYGKISQATSSYVEKISKANEDLKSEQITNFLENLRNFFKEQSNRVKWIELSENRCVFSSTPVQLNSLVKEILAPFKNLCFVDSLGPEAVLNYFSSRLGLENFSVKEISEKPKLIQTDLFSKLIGIGKKKSKKGLINCYIDAKNISTEELVKILSKKSLPAAVLFPSTSQVRDFYEENFNELQKEAFLLTQSNSGGSSKIFHNFSIHENSLLLGTDKFILKFVNSGTTTKFVEHLRVNTLVLCRLPFEQFTHPYQEAVSLGFSNPFEEYSLPRAVYNFHSILQFFNTESLENLYICDSKLSKGYAKSFKQYLDKIPNIKMVGISKALA